MYADVEAAESVDEDFLSALALLHSSDADSAERLRKMLELSIARKTGGGSRGEKSADRRRDDFVAYKYHSSEATGIVSEFEDQLKLMEEFASDDYRRDEEKSAIPIDSRGGRTIADRHARSSGELRATEIDDSTEDREIPRISIPDETADDSVVCKICEGDKLGPLILLECQECQDAYHPLCHRPPVVDIDVYDPRVVWRCGKCIGTSDSGIVDASLVANFHDDGIDSGEDGNRKIGSRVERTSKFARERTRKKEGTTKIGRFGRTRCRDDGVENSPEKTSRSAEKNGPNHRASSHWRKRVGSKLSVTRTSSGN